MNIKYRQLKAFSLAAETGSFKVAASKLAVTQPSFSAQIKELEHDIDVCLFERTTRKCVLTQAGREFYEQIKNVLAQLEDSYAYVKDVGRGERGRLSILALPSLASGIVTSNLALFQQQHPLVRVSLGEAKNSNILEAVRRSEVELGFCSLLVPDRDLNFRPLFQDRLLFVVPSGHPMVTRTPNWQCAEQFNLIIMNDGPVTHALKMNNVNAQPAFEVDQTVTALAMVRHGMGITIIPSGIVPNSNLSGLVCLPIEGPLSTRTLGVVQRADVRPTAAATAFINGMIENRSTGHHSTQHTLLVPIAEIK